MTSRNIAANGHETTLFSNTIKMFGGLAAAWLIGFAIFALDRSGTIRLFPQGTLTVLLECLFEAWIIVDLLYSYDKISSEYRYLLLLFCFLLPADASYLTLHYLIHKNQENWFSFIFTTLPYSIAYLMGITAIYKHMAPRLKNSRWRSFVWLPFLLIVPAIFGILIPLLTAHYRASGWSFGLVEITANSAIAVIFFFCSTLALMMSLEPTFAFIGLAGILSQLGNWGGISAYLLNKNTFTFGEYEFLWLCGIVAFWFSLVVVRRISPDSPGIPASSASRSRSLVVQERMTILGLISASLIIAVFLSPRGAWSYRIVFFGIGLGSYIALLAGELLSRQIIHYASLFGRIVNPGAEEDSRRRQDGEIPEELWQVYRMAFQEDVVLQRIKRNLGILASQVAHDIRSPLAALDAAVKDASELPENRRLMIRGAAGRIRDIANSLLEQYRETSAVANKPTSSICVASMDGDKPVCLVSGLIDSLVTEKRLQYRSRIGVTIDFNMDESSYGLFVKVNPAEFKRVLSNLINNSVEALKERAGGQVTVTLAMLENRVLVRIRDNGAGMSAERLAQIGNRGESHGKANGCGLGLYHAKSSLESWAGCLTTSSAVGRGTTIDMLLPMSEAPQWFISKLAAPQDSSIVILDDDTSIHQVWQKKFEALDVSPSTLDILHFSTPDEIRRWVAGNTDKAREALYLLDFELLGYQETGLSLAKELKIGSRTILVTSRYEEAFVLEGCREIGARMIPKWLVGMVPVETAADQSTKWDAVLIDDDSLAHMTWKISAARSGKSLLQFHSIDSFLKNAESLSFETPIYVDSELGDGLKGEHESLRIYERGFRTIYLTTGHGPDKFRRFTHIKEVVDKEPPWTKAIVAAT